MLVGITLVTLLGEEKIPAMGVSMIAIAYVDIIIIVGGHGV